MLWRDAALLAALLETLGVMACGDDSAEPATAGAGATTSSTSTASSSVGAGAAGGAGGSGASTGAGAGGGAPGPWSFYGMPWSADSLSNWNIGGPKHQRWSYRFSAAKTGSVDHVHVFFIPNPMNLSKTGYADGTGGAIHVDFCPDDGTALHASDCTTSLGSADKADFDLVQGAPKPGYDQANTDFPKLTFAAPIPVTEGALYHVVFSNVDPAPDANWISLDGLVEFDTTTPAPVRPAFTDWGLLLGDLDAGTWTDWTVPDGMYIDTPTMAVGYTDGFAFGCGYMEVWPSDAQARAVDGVGRVREVLVPSRDVTVSGIGVRAKRTGTGGTLVARLENDAGELVDQALIDGAQVPSDRHGWVSGTFGSAQTLVKGSSYHVVLEAQDAGAFLAHCVRDGQSWTFESGSVYADGSAEFDRGDGKGFLGWYGYSDAGDPAYVDGDLQLYFTTD